MTLVCSCPDWDSDLVGYGSYKPLIAGNLKVHSFRMPLHVVMYQHKSCALFLDPNCSLEGPLLSSYSSLKNLEVGTRLQDARFFWLACLCLPHAGECAESILFSTFQSAITLFMLLPF